MDHTTQTWYMKYEWARAQVRQAYLDLLFREPDPEGWGAYTWAMVEHDWTVDQLRANIMESQEYREKHPDLAPIIMGRWQGNFLYPAEHFFGPACVGFDPDRRARYFAYLRERGDTHVLINAEQADWGPSRGHPEYTAGGFNAYAGDGMARLVAVLQEARRVGLTPLVGVIDQPSLRALSLETLIARSRTLVNATAEHVCLYMLSWEIDEVWGHGDIREPNLRRWINEVDWRGRDVGIHYADGMRGGLTFYGSLPPFTVRLMQWENTLSVDELAHEAYLIAEVADRTGTKVCAFEHSSSLNQSPNRPEPECLERARAALAEFRKFSLSEDRFGSMNG